MARDTHPPLKGSPAPMYGHLAFTGISLLGYLGAAAFALISGTLLKIKSRKRP